MLIALILLVSCGNRDDIDRKYARIQVGWSRSEVEALLGPARTGSSDGERAWYVSPPQKRATTGKDRMSIFVVYKDGCVDRKELKDDPVLLYERVVLGMSRQEVEAILGEPTIELVQNNEVWYLAQYVPDLGPRHAGSYAAPGAIRIHYKNDQAVAKRLLSHVPKSRVARPRN